VSNSKANRAQLDDWVERWLKANKDSEAAGDWSNLADFYTEDATYGWNYGPNQEFMAVGREQIREVVMVAEMAGLEGWNYPYQEIVVDDRTGSVVGFWRQLADATRPDGSRYEVAGIGGSWFRYGGNFQWRWQRDWFDLGSTAHTFLEIVSAGKAPQPLLDRMSLHGPSQPGHYTRANLPSSVWPPPVEAGEHLAQAPSEATA